MPDWDLHGKAAGPIRNLQMARYADAAILIWDGKSRGTADMLRAAEIQAARDGKFRLYLAKMVILPP